MGASQSKSKSTNVIINDIVTDIIMQSSQNCTSSNNNVQNMSISDLDLDNCDFNISDISQTANVNTVFVCNQSVQNTTELANQLSTKLDNELEAKIKGLNIGLNNVETETINILKNSIKTNVDISNISSCISNQTNIQDFNIKKIKLNCRGKKFNINNINQLIVSSLVANCIQNNSNVTQAANELDTIIKNKQSSSLEGFDLNTGIIVSAVSSILIAVSIVSILLFTIQNSDKIADSVNKVKNG